MVDYIQQYYAAHVLLILQVVHAHQLLHTQDNDGVPSPSNLITLSKDI